MPQPRRFVVDGHLGRLARGLRLLGFDSWWERDPDDADLAVRAEREGRILLTRDRGLLKRRVVTWGRWVRTVAVDRQLPEVVAAFKLAPLARPWTRCLVCNGRLGPAPRDAVEAKVPPRSREAFEKFFLCDGCGDVFWPGSHAPQLAKRIADALGRPTATPGAQ